MNSQSSGFHRIEDAPIPLKGSIHYEPSLRLPLQPLAFYGPQRSKLGSGAYSSVYLHGSGFAIKYFRSREDSIETTTLREIAILIRCNHPNIVSIIDMVRENDYYMVLPLARDSLGNIIQDLDIDEKINATYQILSGMAYLHGRRILHRDIKPDNILIFYEGDRIIAKISDFGLAMTNGCHIPMGRSHPVYTLPYRAPEVIEHKDYTEKADIWALGCTLYEVFNRSEPLFWDEEIKTEQDTLLWIKEIMRTRIHIQWLQESEVPSPLIDIIDSMLTYNEEGRGSSFDILQIPIFDTIREPHEPSRLSCKENREMRLAYPLSKNPNQSVIGVFSWLYTISVDLKLNSRIYHHAIWIYDAISSILNPQESDVKIYLCASLGIAAIYAGDLFPYSDLVYLSNGLFTEELLRDAERDILTNIKYDIVHTLAWDYLAFNESNLHLVILTASRLRFYYTPKELAKIAMNMYGVQFRGQDTIPLFQETRKEIEDLVNEAIQEPWNMRIKSHIIAMRILFK